MQESECHADSRRTGVEQSAVAARDIVPHIGATARGASRADHIGGRRERRLAAMSVFKRISRYLRALIMGHLDQLENPEMIINEAVREMKENQIKNRELAVQ